MEENLMKHTTMAVSVCLCATFISLVLWTVIIGYNIMNDFQSTITTYYAEAGLSTLIDSAYTDSIDSCNLYKILSVNRNIIVDIQLFDNTGHLFTNYEKLLDIPTKRWSIDILGDSAIGFQITGRQL